DVINQIKIENPHLWDAAMKDEATQMILQGTQLEIEYARDTMPRGVLGMNAAMMEDRKSTRLNSSHVKISYAVFCLKKKNQNRPGVLHRRTEDEGEELHRRDTAPGHAHRMHVLAHGGHYGRHQYRAAQGDNVHERGH